MAIKTYKKTDNVQLSKNFKVSEFSCHGSGCCATVKVDSDLVNYLQKIRDHFGAPITINSGYRCSTHNKRVGGATGSYHTKGQATDIVVKGVKPAEVAKYAESIGILGIGLYDTFVHIDTRTKKSFWYSDKQEHRETFGGKPKKGYAGTFPRLITAKGYMAKGDHGIDVTNLQKFLNWYDNYGIKADGIFGAKTDKAVRAFQDAEGLKVDGKFGKGSLAKAKAVKR